MAAINELKRQKTSEEQDVVEGEKSLCKLPDVVLQHILCFVTMKEAVRTSILSKRWEYLWTSIPTLIFTENGSNLRFDEYVANRTMFIDFVDRAISLRDSNIDKFHLSCDGLGDAVRIRRWFSAVARHNVRVASFSLWNCNKPFELRHCFFTCASLTELRIHVSGDALKMPTSIWFSSLKILKLCGVIFPDDHSTQKLFSGCPLLEELTISKCDWANVKAVCICCPNLHGLYIHDMCMDNQPWDESDDCQIMISGSSLKEFCYFGDFIDHYFFYDCSPLENATIGIYNWDQRARTVAKRLYKLLSGLSDVKKLKLARAAIEVLNYAVDLVASLPLFSNLFVLELNSELINLDSKALVEILQHCPRLETLKFAKGINLASEYDENSGILDPVPACFLSHLKTIIVRKCDGNKDLYKDVVAILLEKVVVLNKLVLYCRESTWSLNEMEKIRKEILELPRASKVLKMELM
ncbi:F-box/LRR-repeat protein [Tripterygium wilfordii]|uniref:F-box/LRR-repeat protein n=1 Tax=Tripterygium wilfordii TaxID=458696 RepID=A0A7J7C4J1_TRIWF|nr:putative F-box/FBD/LRR-repeat protein At3g59240 [Tripterygium wilfordii]XP_038689415.1 putative F-box/FBD/LRR-repeat protein At3g59240 [Tripterygium wilfordii]KAF5729028.1 F-box/LRR-repeat protein [Tripterygium wilfordii]